MFKLKIILAKITVFLMKLLGIKTPTLQSQFEKFIKQQRELGGTNFVPEIEEMEKDGRKGWVITCVFDLNGEKKCMQHLFLPSIEHTNEIKQMMLKAINA